MTITRGEVEDIVRDTVVELLMLDGAKRNDISLNKAKVLESLGASSIDVLEMFVTIEKKLGFHFSEDELNPELISTLSRFIDLICSKVCVEA